MTSDEEDHLVAEIVERLSVRYPGVSARDLQEAVDAAHARFVGRRVRDYVPLLVERSVRAKIAGDLVSS